MDENVIKKVKPHSEDAEKCVLGSMLMDADAIVVAVGQLIPEDFYYKRNQMLFTAMSRLYAENSPVDVITVKERCEELGYPEEVADLENIRQLITLVPTSANIKQYVQVVRDKSTLRHLIDTSERIANDAYLGNMETEELFEQTERDLFQFLQNRRGTDEIVPIQQVVMQAIDNLELAMKTEGNITGVPTGFIDLDNMLTGLHGSELILVAARPAMGKTAFVLNIAAYACFRKRIPVAVFSLEMGKEQLVTRMMAMESLVDSQKIRTGDMNTEDLEKVMEAANQIAMSPLMIDDTPGITVAEVRAKCRKMKQQNGDLGLIIIDYLQLMSGGRRIESRQQEVAEISRSLKGLAKELDVPIIALSQLSRAVEARDDHKPRMSDLRESGSIEQDADVVMFIYRDEYYNPDTTTKPGTAEIIIGKQRSGATGSVDLIWLGQYTKFANKDRARARIQEPD
ncbi:MAG: replicative DNA helicase [Lachnospiraceae bacterium]|nr:replicative DNA helicase [Lachnospiraceae bacterium]